MCLDPLSRFKPLTVSAVIRFVTSRNKADQGPDFLSMDGSHSQLSNPPANKISSERLSTTVFTVSVSTERGCWRFGPERSLMVRPKRRGGSERQAATGCRRCRRPMPSLHSRPLAASASVFPQWAAGHCEGVGGSPCSGVMEAQRDNG